MPKTLLLTFSLVRPRNHKNSPWTVHSIDSCSLLTAPSAYQRSTWPDAKDAAYSKVCSNNAAAVQRLPASRRGNMNAQVCHMADASHDEMGAAMVVRLLLPREQRAT